MKLFTESDQFQKYLYVVKDIQVLLPDGEENLIIEKNRFMGLDVEDNYEENYFPLIKITLVINSETYYKILKYKNECKFYLRIHKKYMKNEDKTKMSSEQKFLLDTFDLITDENTDDMLNALKEKISSDDYKKRKSEGNVLDETDNNRVSFYLFKSSIAGTKTNVNKILANANVSDAIAYLMSVAKIKNVLMSQPDNTKVYEELMIPYQSVLKSLGFLDTYYGLYKSGSIIYFGVDYTYIIPYNGKCSVTSSSDKSTNTNIVIPKSSNTLYSGKLGSVKRKNDESNYVIGDSTSINIMNKSISNNYLYANDIEVVDSYDENTETSKSNAKSKTENFVKVFQNKTENEFIGDMYTAQTNAKSDIISIRLQNFDISAFTPNKQFNVIFEDSKYTKKYNGKYILAGMSYSLNSEGNELLINGTIVLRKS